MKRQKKKYSRPQRPFDKARINEENVLKDRYGLKNKKEIWKADASIGRVRNQAKELITAEDKEKKSFVDRLQKKGYQVENIAGALSLDKEDWLKRRLQTILFSKGLANTSKQARQLITHKHVAIGNQTVNIPSYQVSLEDEPQVTLNITLKTAVKKKSKEEEIRDEVLEGEENGIEKDERKSGDADEEIKELEEEVSEENIESAIEKTEDIPEEKAEVASVNLEAASESKREGVEPVIHDKGNTDKSQNAGDTNSEVKEKKEGEVKNE